MPSHKVHSYYTRTLHDLPAFGKAIDLLPDREESTLRIWLNETPGIATITRDRYGKYQKAATKGAPQAQQVTARWHHLQKGLKLTFQQYRMH